MHRYQDMVKDFLVEYIVDTRKGKGMKKSAMSICLRIDPRSYLDIEAGKFGLSASSLLLFECTLEDLELLAMVHDFKNRLGSIEEKMAM